MGRWGVSWFLRGFWGGENCYKCKCVKKVVGENRSIANSTPYTKASRQARPAATAGVVADLIPTVEVDTTMGWCVPGA